MNEFDNPVERQVEHRGYTILLSSEKCLGGWLMKYYSVFRESDGYECTSGFSNDEDTLDTWVQILRDRIDAELLEADPWDENAEIGGHRMNDELEEIRTRHNNVEPPEGFYVSLRDGQQAHADRAFLLSLLPAPPAPAETPTLANQEPRDE